jgi:hypothetical protein
MLTHVISDFYADVWNFFTFHADVSNFLLSMLTYGISLLSMLAYGISLLSMLTYGISLLSMLTYGISLLSMLTYGIPTTLGRFDTNFTHYLSYLIPPQVTIFLFSIVKRGVPLEYFSFLN